MNYALHRFRLRKKEKVPNGDLESLFCRTIKSIWMVEPYNWSLNVIIADRGIVRFSKMRSTTANHNEQAWRKYSLNCWVNTANNNEYLGPCSRFSVFELNFRNEVILLLLSNARRTHRNRCVFKKKTISIFKVRYFFTSFFIVNVLFCVWKSTLKCLCECSLLVMRANFGEKIYKKEKIERENIRRSRCCK